MRLLQFCGVRHAKSDIVWGSHSIKFQRISEHYQLAMAGEHDGFFIIMRSSLFFLLLNYHLAGK